MENSLFNNYLFDLLDSLEQNLSAFITDQNPESLHRIRIDLKKIKALFSFAEYMNKEKYDAAKLKPLFGEAGEIREMHLNIQLLSSAPQPPKRLITQLKKEKNILTQEFIENGSGYIKLVKDFKGGICFPEIRWRKKRIIKYFKKEQKKTNEILQNIDREGLHEYRKKIKKLVYVYNALPKKIQNKIDLNEAEITKLQKRLGDWHDTYSAIHFLSRKPLPLKTAEYVFKLKEEEKRRFNKLVKSLIKKRK
ncbi:MAG: CHAD domain-containing protein [Algoriphagus sp.]|jgi:CHAD domain-containing protein|uniref:CHAD domain-containing protein n=1 Tax=Algoriphagus sp. TaxID=1872435 RepID=UPI00262BAB71|nr:CHAD domain-containing protein [Algoriphagus sp.]MDG1276071.1 CHAD domain-containing protein [Algoriphagus sp.]